MSRRKPIPSVIETQVLVLSRRRCALCFGLMVDLTEKAGQICHIDQNSSNNSLENLVYLCLPHHDAYDSRRSQSKGYTDAELKYYRKGLLVKIGSDFPLPNPTEVELPRPSYRLTHESVELIWDDVYDLVFGGFVPSDEIAETVIDMYSEEYASDSLAPYVTGITAKLLEEHARQQAKWPALTDCDRLDAAFAALEVAGIVCRQDFADCLSCGYSKIWNEISEQQRMGREIRGFTFFHQQDTDCAARGGGIRLGYGSILEENIPSELAVASEVADMLRCHDLTVEWDGTISKRIVVSMNWQRRRTEQHPAT